MEGGSVSGRTGFVNLGVFATVDCVFATVSSVCTLKIELVTKQFQKKKWYTVQYTHGAVAFRDIGSIFGATTFSGKGSVDSNGSMPPINISSSAPSF